MTLSHYAASAAPCAAVDGCRGVVFLQQARRGSHVLLDLPVGLLPVLMPLIARLRRLGDLDAEPAVIDAHLAGTGLAAQVRRRPGLRMPVAFDGFEAAVLELVGAGSEALGNLVAAASESLETGWPGLTHVGLDPKRVAALGRRGLAGLGVPAGRCEGLAAVARAVAAGSLRLEPGAEPLETLRRLRQIPGIEPRTATAIVMRALHWPDAFSDEAAGLQRLAERWRPWRAYAAAHLRLDALEQLRPVRLTV
jgi:AraC family transcriptional regulator of adaptative response / DNA-3-methyladenine glycosylase II